jgi:hypothetical protein
MEKGVRKWYTKRLKMNMRTKILIGLCALLLVGGGTLALASNSLPGSMLYGVKLGFLEKIEGVFAGGGKARAEFQLKLADRRLDEAVKSALKGNLDQKAQEQVLLNFNAQMKGIEGYITKLQTDGDIAGIKDIAVKTGQTLALKADILTQANAIIASSTDPEEQEAEGSLDFLLLRVGNTLAAAASIAAGTLVEDEAPTPEIDPSTVDEWGNPIN